MSQFHLLRPEWLLALIPLSFLLYLLYRQKMKTGGWRSACDPALLPYLLIEQRIGRRLPVLLLLASGGLLAILALAGPAWQKLEQPLFRQSSSLVIMLDLSRSMDSTDIKPSRLARARFELLDILKRRREGDTALIVYAAQPFVVTPLTDDTATISALVNSLTTDIVPSQGSRPDLALQSGIRLLEQAGAVTGDLLFITDGIGSELLDKSLKERPLQYRVNVLAVGTGEGAPIPLPAGGFLKNNHGEIVIAGLDREELRSLASQGGGNYSEVTADDRDIDLLLSALANDPLSDPESISGLTSDQWHEEGPWLLLLLLPLAALAFRRGYLVLVLSLTLPLPDYAHALDWDDLWQRPDQRAARTLATGAASKAASEFQDPAWRSAAHYRAGEYQESLDALSGIDTPQSEYNRGNALAKLGRLQEAIDAYDRALSGMPEDADAKYNRELVEKLIQEQQKQATGEQEQPNSQQSDRQNSEQGEQQAGQNGQSREPGEQESQPSEADASSNESGRADNQPGNDESQEKPAQQSAEANGEEQSGQAPEPSRESERPDEEAAQDSLADISERSDQEDEATRQWLRRIPDDPGGLLKRKFRYQYQQQFQGRSERQPW